jgi:hypothetical protein
MVRIPWLEHGYLQPVATVSPPLLLLEYCSYKSQHPYLTPVQLRTVLYTLASKWEDYGKIKSILYTITDLSRISGYVRIV